jgi:hypothetical protein
VFHRLGPRHVRLCRLVRTSNEGKREEGISFLLIDMKSPGIKIDPIYLVDGTRTPMRSEVNQVFFTDVKVPVENLVGEENKGWTYAKYLLEFERGGQAFGPRLRKALLHLLQLASGPTTPAASAICWAPEHAGDVAAGLDDGAHCSVPILRRLDRTGLQIRGQEALVLCGQDVRI